MKTPQDQVRGGREVGDFTKYSCVLIVVSTTCQTIHNPPSHAEMDLCGDSVNK